MSEHDTAALGTDEQRVLADISKMIVSVLKERGGVDSEIGMNTRFIADLGMASLDLVELSVQLRDHYGERVTLAEFLADVDLDDIFGLSVGRLVRYVSRSLADTGES